jgi:uncharacterized membrane protein YhaH (DUF805 family)
MLMPQTMVLAQGAGGINDAQVEGASPFLVLVVWLVALAVAIFIIAGMWKTFTKAGKPGWAAIVPIYNAIVILEIAGRPLWWIILLMIPCVGAIVAIIVMIDFAAKYGQSAGFGIGLALLGFIFFPILGFGDAQYQGGGRRY